MSSISPLCSLPAELLLMVMECLECPSSIRAFAFSYPKALHLLRVHRQRVVGTAVRAFDRKLPIEKTFGYDVRACRLRLALRNVAFLDPAEAEQEVCKADFYGEWCNLKLLCEMASLNNEIDRFISRYSVHAWSKIQDDYARVFSHRRAGVSRFEPYRTVDLTDSELRRLREAFLGFECKRHHLVYDKTLLHETKLHQATLFPIYSEDSFSEGYSIHNSFNGACLSIFCFIFQCYENLIRRVDRQLELEELRRDSEPRRSELVRIARFRARTRDKELRYIALLCLQGYVCLTVAEHYTNGELRQFVLGSFMWFCKDGTNNIPDPCGRLVSNLEHFSPEYYSNGDTAYEPWSRGRFFWDQARMLELRQRVTLD
ncbi:uncharacterized protein FPRO_06762 [Fusarium proliferatum ET1]|uniref:Uncharacterized protein n=1 Tax=Fusarium proliferatum (strain ET1) TaxID=1227346 RepID=A0A1L7VBF6_FUSPR|nr:uncharacterized protein FPRO_06762 [Fusarium proliferatum ET1]CZR38047.1 uncharacterized protein FPRO_06762 [Fusarium proliferatum ET1]